MIFLLFQFTRQKCSYLRINFLRLLYGICLISVCAIVTNAQMGGIDTDPGDPGTGGRNTIQGNIYYPGGRRVDKRVKVRLRSMLGVEQFTLTDDSGAFSFRRLQSGTYNITVDAGSEFEPATETVDMIEPARRRNDPGKSITVQITLQAKQKAVQAAGTVSVTSSTIPEGALKLYTDALQSSKTGDHKKAIEQLDGALKIYPEYIAAINEKGVQYMRLKQMDKAAEAFSAALKIAPDAFTPRLNYGMLLVQTKNYPKAVDELYKALKKDSTSAIGHLYIGRALVNLGSYGDAEKFLQLAVKFGNEKDETVEAHRYLGAVYIEKKSHEMAAKELETYLNLVPNAKDAKNINDMIKQLRAQSKSN
jgi:tetratricopeptide (TPR) repeat protein